MKVSELIALLQKADPDAETFGEYEGSIFPVDIDDVRVGPVQLLRLIEASPTRKEPHDRWDVARADVGDPIVKSCEGILLWPGESAYEWPQKLKDR